MFHVPRRHATLSVLRGAIKLVSALKDGKANKPAAMDIDAVGSLMLPFTDCGVTSVVSLKYLLAFNHTAY